MPWRPTSSRWATARRAGPSSPGCCTAGVNRLVDVRRYPGSRAYPHVSRDALTRWLPAAGVNYRWEERLGGRRRLPAESPDKWWRVGAFRAYANHMRSAEFLETISSLLAELQTVTTAMMCSESLWWRCHLRLIADFATLARGITTCPEAAPQRMPLLLEPFDICRAF
jgi:uncharacterized protein (DUF488 family)